MTVLSVISWSPADAATVDQGAGVAVNLAATNTAALEALYDSSADFATGAHSQTAVVTDQLRLALDGAAYYSSGTWTSPNIATDGVGRYSSGAVTWTETVPTDTTVTVEIRWNGGAWQAVTNGAQLPGISYDQDMAALSGFEDCDLRVSFATADTDATPGVEDLRLYFDPCNPDLLAVEIGDVTATAAAGTLDLWGVHRISGGAAVLSWSDLTVDAAPWWHEPEAAAVAVNLVYQSVTIDSIAWAASRDTYVEAIGAASLLVPIAGFWVNAPNALNWAVILGSAGYTAATCEWLLVDKGIAIHADAWYYVGHIQIDDVPGEVIVAAPSTSDFPGELIVYGWRRDDHPGELLVQGWRIDDIPGQVIPGVYRLDDLPGEVIAATRRFDDHPGEILVYGVNRANVLEVRVVDEATWAALVAAGYGVS